MLLIIKIMLIITIMFKAKITVIKIIMFLTKFIIFFIVLQFAFKNFILLFLGYLINLFFIIIIIPIIILKIYFWE